MQLKETPLVAVGLLKKSRLLRYVPEMDYARNDIVGGYNFSIAV
ncbi:MAG: hypothetical protein ABFD79_01220 [Phycisphaerales bacterium]